MNHDPGFHLSCDENLSKGWGPPLLPQAFTHDPDRLARFEREAKVLASLNHPNIGHIYGLEEAEGLMVMPVDIGQSVRAGIAESLVDGPRPACDCLMLPRGRG